MWSNLLLGPVKRPGESKPRAVRPGVAGCLVAAGDYAGENPPKKNQKP
jgi:hypothetical protein